MQFYKHKRTGKTITSDSYYDLDVYDRNDYQLISSSSRNDSTESALLSGVIGYATDSALLGGLLGGSLLGGILGDSLDGDLMD